MASFLLKKGSKNRGIPGVLTLKSACHPAGVALMGIAVDADRSGAVPSCMARGISAGGGLGGT